MGRGLYPDRLRKTAGMARCDGEQETVQRRVSHDLEEMRIRYVYASHEKYRPSTPSGVGDGHLSEDGGGAVCVKEPYQGIQGDESNRCTPF